MDKFAAIAAVVAAVGAFFTFLGADTPKTPTLSPVTAHGAAAWTETAPVVLPLIAKWEGKRNEAYLDTIADPPIWTVCYGHTETARPGLVLSDRECLDLLKDEVAVYWMNLRPAFTPTTRQTRLPPARDAAFTSLAYNVGVGGTSKSTAVRRLNAGNIAGACEAIGWWNKAGSRVIRGLVNRRAEETKLCLQGI